MQHLGRTDQGAAKGATLACVHSRRVTYCLPTIGWAGLLDGIVRDAPPGSVIATATAEMRALSERVLGAAICPSA